jgi:hypothetical protein
LTQEEDLCALEVIGESHASGSQGVRPVRYESLVIGDTFVNLYFFIEIPMPRA